jgi:hypothetical protein
VLYIYIVNKVDERKEEKNQIRLEGQTNVVFSLDV